MGEVIVMGEYLERKASETDPDQLKQRIVDIGREILILTSEKNRLEKVLLQGSGDNPSA